jgi:hypothetical protein
MYFDFKERSATNFNSNVHCTELFPFLSPQALRNKLCRSVLRRRQNKQWQYVTHIRKKGKHLLFGATANGCGRGGSGSGV